jgi:RNA polymerase sigma factor (TIGR02999 family)
VSEVTRILDQIQHGDPDTASQLLPLVYDELRKLAARRLAQEKPGQTLEATALVHEAYLRLVDVEKAQHWKSRGHFFAAAAEAMRRILIDSARSKAAQKRGGAHHRIDLNRADLATQADPVDLLLLNDTLDALARTDPEAAQFTKLRFFAGLSVQQAGEMLGLSRSSAYELWTFARAFLYSQLKDQSPQ